MSRPCERFCPKPDGCGLWKHHSRFHSRRRPNSTVGGWEFDRICRDCQQKHRNEIKNADRPRAIVEQRAAQRARAAGVPAIFFMVNMNYRALIPPLRALMSPEGLCPCCGHPFLNERDIQIEHRFPPRGPRDWARLHARNLGFACGSCNRTKGPRDPAQWLDDQEGARLSNEVERVAVERPSQLTLAELMEAVR